MLKKSCAIMLSIALAVGILVHGSFAYDVPSDTVSIGNLLEDFDTLNADQTVTLAQDALEDAVSDYDYIIVRAYPSEDGYSELFFFFSDVPAFIDANYFFLTARTGHYRFISLNSSVQPTISGTSISPQSGQSPNGGYWCSPSVGLTSDSLLFANYTSNVSGSPFGPNLSESFTPIPSDTRFMDVYMTMSTYGSVKYLCVEVDDIILSSSWVSVRFTDLYGPFTTIIDYPFDFFTANGHSYIKIMPSVIGPDLPLTVTSVIYSGSSSWGYKEVSDLSLTFEGDPFPSPIPSVSPVPEYWYYDTTYINYNGGETNKIYDCFNTFLDFLVPFGESSPIYFVDHDLYLLQPFSFTYIAIPRFSNQFYYDSFFDDVIYQYDVVFDELYDSIGPYLSFDNIYGSGMYQDLLSDVNSYFTQTGSYDLSPVFEEWYSAHKPLCYQFPYYDGNSYVETSPYQAECSMIVSDSFYFKQTNYLLGDSGDILSELSERFFKLGGFADSLFGNMSSLYNLNLQYYDSALQQLTGLSYWLNNNDISSGLDNIGSLLTSVDSYVSSVDSKLNYLVTIDSDLNDLLEWFQNQEDSDVVLTLPDFNPSILVEIYGENIGDLIGFFQDFVNVLPDFDFSDFPNFFDRSNDLVSDFAGQNDDLLDNLMDPYEYDDSGLSTFGWD